MSGRDVGRLGRGLASLLGDNESTGKAAVGRAVPLAAIEPGPFQPRSDMDPVMLDELAASIAKQGVLQPILVRPYASGRFQIIAGERRWRAARLAGLDDIPCFVRPMSDQEAMAAALVENLQRLDLDPIEEAEGFKRLITEFGITQEELGTALGKSRSHITNQIRLLQLPGSVLRMVRDRSLSAGHARAVLTSPDPQSAAETIIARGLSVRQAEELCSKANGRDATVSPRARRPVDANVAAAEADLAERLGLKVEISFNGQAGAVRLHYRSVEQLDHLLMLLGR